MEEVYVHKAEDLDIHQESKNVVVSDWVDDEKDLSILKKVEQLSIQCKNHQNLGSLITLKKLSLSYINKNKLEINTLKNLESLSMTRGNISNLNFLKSFNKLKKLEANYLYKLNDISGLNYISNNLERLEFEACKNINWDNYEFNFPKLRSLKLIGCTIKDIDFVSRIPEIEELVLTNSNILSGDISPAKDIKFVSIDNKKHYNYWYDFGVRIINKRKKD